MEENGFPVAPAILGMVLGAHAGGELHQLDDQGRRRSARSSSARSPARWGVMMITLLVVPPALRLLRRTRPA